MEKSPFDTAANYSQSAGVQQPENTVNRQPRSSYSLAGPNQYLQQEERLPGHGFERYGARPQPSWGLAKPFPHMIQRNGSQLLRRSRAPNPEGNNINNRDQPQGLLDPKGPVNPVRTSGNPAPNVEIAEDEDESGHASGWNEENDEKRLTEEEYVDEAGEKIEIPNFWFGIRRKMREPLAEFLGSLIVILIGTTGALQSKTSNGTATGSSAASWGIGSMMAIYIAGGVSGAHISPSVSIFLSVFRGFPARKIPIYIAAQIAGAICGTLIAYGIYKDAIMDYDPGLTSTPKGTGTAFFSLPRPFVSPATAFFTDFTSAAIMAGTAMALGDEDNAPPGSGMHAFILGLVGFALASGLGYNTGLQTNPAKDLASRLVPYWVGYGGAMWSNAWWVEAWAAAIFGGLFGCLVYDVAIFEGDESPINWPAHKRRKSRKGTKGRWMTTGLFGKARRDKAKRELADGTIGVRDKGEGTRLDGHGSV